MYPAIQVKLTKAVVKPLLQVVRELCAAPLSPETARAATPILADRRELLAQFGWSLSLNSTVSFDELNARPVLRACAELRVRLRSERLSSLDDGTLQTGDLDIATLAEPLRTDFTTYLFLATLQEQILQHFDPLFETTLERHPLAETGAYLGRSLRRLRQRLRGTPDPALAAPPPAVHDEPDCRVVVINDPINLMSYVKAVFLGVLGHTSGTARRLMEEVHERGRTVVWSGPCAQAEAHAAQLRAWHLTATVDSGA